MRVGCCASMIAPDRDPLGIESVEAMAAAGFDYIELSLAHLAALDDGAFQRVVDRVARSGIRCEACNNFFPPHVRLTGPEADLDAAVDYATRAMGRAASPSQRFKGRRGPYPRAAPDATPAPTHRYESEAGRRRPALPPP